MGFDPLTALSGSDKQGTTPGPGQGQERDAAKDANAAEVTRQLDPVDETVGSMSAEQAASDVAQAIEAGRADVYREHGIPTARMDHPGGPICACGRPSAHQDGWCGVVGCGFYPESDPGVVHARLQARIREARSRMNTAPSLPAVRPACATCNGRGVVPVLGVMGLQPIDVTCPGCGGGSGAA